MIGAAFINCQKKLRTGGNPESVLSFILSKWTGVRDSANYSHGINIGGSKIRKDEMLEPKKMRKMENFPKKKQPKHNKKSNRRVCSKQNVDPLAQLKAKINPTEWNFPNNSDVWDTLEKDFQRRVFPALQFAAVQSGRMWCIGPAESSLRSLRTRAPQKQSWKLPCWPPLSWNHLWLSDKDPSLSSLTD